MSLTDPRLDELRRFVEPAALEAALRSKARLGGSLALNLVRIGVVDEVVFAEYATRRYSLRRVALEDVGRPDPALVQRVPGEVVREGGLIPLAVGEGERLVVGVIEPLSDDQLREAEFFAGARVEPCVITLSEFRLVCSEVTGIASPLPSAPFATQTSAAPEECIRCAEALEPAAAEWVVSYHEQIRASGSVGTVDDAGDETAEAGEPPPAPPEIPQDAPTDHGAAPSQAPKSSRSDSDAVTPRATQELPAGLRPIGALAGAAASASNAAAPMSSVPDDGAPARGRDPSDAVEVVRGPGLEGVFGAPVSLIDRMGYPGTFARAVVRNMLRSIADAESTDDIMRELTDGFGLIYPTAIVLSVRANLLQVWHECLFRGPRSLVGCRIEYEDVQPWDRVVRESVAFRGRLGSADPLRILLGRDLGRDTLVIPISIRLRTVAVLVVDGAYRGDLESIGGQYEAVESALNEAFVRVLRKRRVGADV